MLAQALRHHRRRLPTTVPEVRREARRLIASYTEPAKKNNGPSTPGRPMMAFAEEFLDRAMPVLSVVMRMA